MKLQQTNRSYFLVNKREINRPYSFESADENDPDFQTIVTSVFAMYFLQRLELLEEIHKKLCLTSQDIYRITACFFVFENIAMDKLSEVDFFHGLYKQAGITELHMQILLSHLLTSEHLELRKTGALLIPHIPIKSLSNIINYCKRMYDKFPRCARTAIKTYLRTLEENETKFDKLLFYDKKSLKSIYASLHIKPSKRTQDILFKNEPPKGSLAEAIKILRTKFDSDLICGTVDKFSISGEDAIKNINYISAKTVKKLVYKMSVDEIIKCLPILKRIKAFKNEDIRIYVRDRLQPARNKKNSSDLRRIKKYVQKQEIHFKSQVYRAILSLIEKKYSIKKHIALLIDVSGSMYAHQEIGKAFINIFSSMLDKKGKLSVWFFAENAAQLDIKDKEWETNYDKYSGTAQGSAPGAPLIKMAEQGQKPDVLVIISDGNENASPTFAEAYKTYVDKIKKMPYIILVKAGYLSDKFETNLSDSGLTCFVTEFTNYEEAMSDIGSFVFSYSYEDIMSNILKIFDNAKTESDIDKQAIIEAIKKRY